MKHLKPVASAAMLTTLVISALSCSGNPERNAPGVRVGNGIRASCIPETVAQRRAAMAGAVDPGLRLKVALQLPLRNQPELTQLLHDLYDPRSPRYHKYLSVSEFTDRFGPTAADYKKVVAWAKSKGLSVTN